MSEEVNQEEMTTVQSIQPGDVLSGRVVKIEEKQALVDIGYKNEAILPIGEVSSVHIDSISDMLSEGEEIRVKVTRFDEDDDRIIVSKKQVDAEHAWEELQRKFDSGEVFEAKVVSVVKGGLVVDVGVRGFIPASMVERHYVEDFSDYKGKTLTLKVVELDQDKNKVILSHRAVLEEEAQKARQEAMDKLEVGSVIQGVVQRLTDFGAFVDVGGVDGLVHVSEIAWHHVDKPSDVLKEGDTVNVKVLKVDKENERISLSIKETLPGPWDLAGEQLQIGQVVEGTVKRLASFGAFVEVLPGVEGLVHISQIARRHIGTPEEVLEVGQTVKVKILDMDLENQRISLSIKEAEEPLTRPERPTHDLDSDKGSGMSITLGDVLGDQLRKFK